MAEPPHRSGVAALLGTVLVLWLYNRREKRRKHAIELAKLMEAEARRLQKLGEELDELNRQAYAQIADAIFATQGTDTYPDATFTLRLAFGRVKGYVDGGRPVPPWTTVGGAFAHERRHGAKEPWKLPLPQYIEHLYSKRFGKEMPENVASIEDRLKQKAAKKLAKRERRMQAAAEREHPDS